MSLTIGLVGCGKWGRNIARDLLALQCRLFVADPAEEARRWTLDQGAAEAVQCADELPDCDGFVVAVPIPDLAPECARLLARRKPIFAEKTLCLSLQAADELSRLGGDAYLFAMHKWRYHPGIEALRAVAASGRIGTFEEMFTVRHGWVEDFHGGDAFWTVAVHDLTIIEHITGSIPSRIVWARAITDQQGLPVSLTAVLGEGPIANLSVNSRHARKVSGVSIHGDKGSALLGDACDEHITVRDEYRVERIAIDTTFPLYLELQEFVRHVAGGPRPRCGLSNARAITRCLLALREAALPGSQTPLKES